MNEKYRDHALTGEWQDCRDCHVKPDVVRIYRKQGSLPQRYGGNPVKPQLVLR